MLYYKLFLNIIFNVDDLVVSIPVFKTLCDLELDFLLDYEVCGIKYNYDNREKLKYILYNESRTKQMSMNNYGTEINGNK